MIPDLAIAMLSTMDCGITSGASIFQIYCIFPLTNPTLLYPAMFSPELGVLHKVHSSFQNARNVTLQENQVFSRMTFSWLAPLPCCHDNVIRVDKRA